MIPETWGAQRSVITYQPELRRRAQMDDKALLLD
jgi:hypothetical protein